MILVDVAVPSVEKKYDFRLDENAQIAMVIEEIAEMVSQMEQCTIVGNREKLMLCQYGDPAILDRHATLQDYGIKSGSRLLLV